MLQQEYVLIVIIEMSDQLWFKSGYGYMERICWDKKNHGGDQKEKLKKLKTFKNLKIQNKLKKQNKKIRNSK